MMIAFYVRSAIDKAQKFSEVPPLSPRQTEAMDAVDALARDPRLYLDMEFREGDIQLLCNHYIFHSRTSFVDFDRIEDQRHLLRLWLACPEELGTPSCRERVGRSVWLSGGAFT